MRISDWSSDVCSSDLEVAEGNPHDDAQGDPESEIAFKGGHGFSSGRRDAVAVFVDHRLAIFLDEGSALRRQQVQHLLGRTAQPHPFRAHHDRTVDQDGMLHHGRSEEHTSELQSLMRISYAVFCLNKKTQKT